MSIFTYSCKTNIYILHPKIYNGLILRSIKSKLPNTFVNGVDKDGFRILQLLPEKSKADETRNTQTNAQIPEHKQLKSIVDQDWTSIWPTAKSFHPDLVPIPIRQSFPEPNEPPKGRYANTELIKIPNFLHLTPPAIKKHCEALQKFCTKWPEELGKKEKDITKHFPLEVTYSDYCYAGPSIREPLSRIVTFKVKLSSLALNDHAKDKMLRLVGYRYDSITDYITIITDRCPLRKQNYDYAEFLLTALYHESQRKEDWEQKTPGDMEYYDWERHQSRINLVTMYAWPEKPQNYNYSHIKNVAEYKEAVTKLKNKGENEATLDQYKKAVKKIMFFKSQEV